MSRVLAAIAVLMTATATAIVARADDRITDDLPYKLPEGHVRAGLWKLEYGVHDVRRLEIGTYTLPYLALIAGVKTVNAHAKYQLLDRRRWTLAATLGVTYVDLSGIDVDAKISSTDVADVIHQIDDRTTVNVAATGNASIEELRGASTTAAFHWSGKHLRLRIGAGWGNYNVPVVNFVTPTAIPYPELDVYWVF